MDVKLDDTVLAWRQIQGDVVVVDLRNSEYFSLTASAQHLWPLLARGTTAEELSASLVAEYEIPAETARQDVHLLCEDLRHRGVLLETSSSDGVSR